jgi:hypothetical protein
MALGDVYEKIDATTWVKRAAIMGPQGPVGTPGEKWFTGSFDPTSGIGSVGDWYLNGISGDYFEKTAATVWTLRGNLRGPTGAPGPAGAGAGTGGWPRVFMSMGA